MLLRLWRFGLLVAAVSQLIHTDSVAERLPVLDPSDGTRTQCAMRRLGYQHALKLQPFRARAEMQELFDALQLQTVCGDEFRQSSPSWPAQEARLSEVFPHGAIHVYADGPKKLTVEAALEQWRTTGRKVPILLHDGVHLLNATLNLSAADSGLRISAAPGETNAWLSGGVELSNLEWQAAKGKPKGVFVANVSAYSLKEITGLYSVDAETYAPSFRWQRARYPNGLWERDLWGLCSTNDCLDLGPAYTTPQRWGGETSGENASVTGAAAIPKAEIKAWWPAGNATTGGWGRPQQHPFLNATQGGEACAPGSKNCTTWEFTLGCGGPCKLWGSWDSSPANSGCQYWCGDIGNVSIHGCGGGPYEAAMSRDGWLGIPVGVSFKEGSRVQQRMRHWRHPAVAAARAVVHAWMDSSWFTNQFQVTDFDAGTASLMFHDPDNPGFPLGGWQGAHSWNPGKTGEPGSDSTVAPIIIENVAEELDQTGEFYFDPETEQLFLFPNATDSDSSEHWQPQPPKMRLIATRLKVLITARGTKDAPVRNISISSIGLRDSATPMLDTRWGVPSGGDWALPHTAALHFHGVEHVTIRDCKFVRLDNSAVLLSGYARHVQILRNYARWLGMGFAVAWGDTDGVDGTAGTQPQYTIVDGNFVSEVGSTQKQSSFWFQAKSCLNTVTNNIAFNGPRAGINLNDGYGGGNTISSNLLWNWCRESGDHGPINAWSREPFLSTVKYGEGMPSYEAKMSTISKNIISSDYGSSQGFDTDDGTAWMNIHSNVFYAGDGVKMDYSGHDKHFHDNLVVVACYDGQACVSGGGYYPPGHNDRFENNHCIITGCRSSENRSNHHGRCQEQIGQFQCDGSSPAALASSMSHSWTLKANHYYTHDGKARLPCKDANLTVVAAATGGSGVEAGSTASSLPSDEDLVAMARRVLSMKTDDGDILDGTCTKPTSSVIYVSPSAENCIRRPTAAHDGISPLRPLCSAESASAIVRARTQNGTEVPARGVQVVLDGGIHVLATPIRLSRVDSGTAGSEITWRGCPFTQPGPSVLSAGTQITGWQRQSSKGGDTVDLWHAPLPAELRDSRHLWVNGRRAARTRGNATEILGTSLELVGSFPHALGYKLADSHRVTWRNPETVELNYDHAFMPWTAPRVGVASLLDGDIERGFRELRMKDPAFNILQQFGGDCPKKPATLNGTRCPRWWMSRLPTVVENYRMPERPGEFYIDVNASKIFYIPNGGEDMQHATVWASRLENAVYGDSVHNIAFENVTFSHSTWQQPSGNYGYATLQSAISDLGWRSGKETGGLVGQRSMPTAAVEFRSSHSVTIRNCSVLHVGGSGIRFDSFERQNSTQPFYAGSQNNTVTATLVSDISAHGIQIGFIDKYSPSLPLFARDVGHTIVSTAIFNATREYTEAVGIFIGHTERTVVDRSTIKHVAYSGISAGWDTLSDGPRSENAVTATASNTIRDTHISNWMEVHPDGAAIYMWGNQRTSFVVGCFLEDGGTGLEPLGLGFHGGALYADAGTNGWDISKTVVSKAGHYWAFDYSEHNVNVTIHDCFTDTPNEVIALDGCQWNNTIVNRSAENGSQSWPAEAQQIIARAGASWVERPAARLNVPTQTHTVRPEAMPPKRPSRRSTANGQQSGEDDVVEELVVGTSPSKRRLF